MAGDWVATEAVGRVHVESVDQIPDGVNLLVVLVLHYKSAYM
jgi:hypothetical protein